MIEYFVRKTVTKGLSFSDTCGNCNASWERDSKPTPPSHSYASPIPQNLLVINKNQTAHPYNLISLESNQMGSAEVVSVPGVAQQS
jgi:hypothetical protein